MRSGIVLALSVAIFCFGALTQLHAQTETKKPLSYVPLEPLRPGDGCAVGAIDCNPYPNLAVYLSVAYRVLLTVGALLGVLTFTVGGVSYMTSEAAGAKSAAKERMKSALWGLIILAAAALILQTINSSLLTFDFSRLQTLGGGGGGATTVLTAGPTQPTQAQITECERSGKHMLPTPSGYVCQ